MMLYERNEVMQLLGKQPFEKFRSKEIEKDLQSIWSAYMEDDSKTCFMDMFMDVFTYGCIHGMRMERKRKSRKEEISIKNAYIKRINELLKKFNDESLFMLIEGILVKQIEHDQKKKAASQTAK